MEEVFRELHKVKDEILDGMLIMFEEYFIARLFVLIITKSEWGRQVVVSPCGH